MGLHLSFIVFSQLYLFIHLMLLLYNTRHFTLYKYWYMSCRLLMLV